MSNVSPLKNGMTPESENVTGFLESLQARMEQLQHIWSVYSETGAQPGRPHLTLSGRPFSIGVKGEPVEYRGSLAMGLIIAGQDGREYDIGVDLMWDEEKWIISTQAWVEGDAGGQDLLRELPQRSACDLQRCIEQLEAAIADLASFTYLVKRKGGG